MPAEEPHLSVIGRTIGVYRVVSLLGAGGMGEVYRAHDSRLGRDVALKILPGSFGSDPDRLARFEREARLLAALNHPNIAAIYGFEASDEMPALVLELVEGPTLADRLRSGPIPVGEALALARQIAEALESAHEKGIVHRDLKPANIKIAPGGMVKVLDFGLAKLADASDQMNDSRAHAVSESPTFTAVVSRGVILGTAPYMSPEQARGLVVDKRTDIWAFGCVLYEMLTRRPAFPGQTTTDVLAAVVERDPDWTVLPQTTPQRIRDLLRRCLSKHAKQRLHDIADARIEIEDALAHPGGDSRAEPAPRPRQRLAWIAAVVLVTAGGTTAALWDRSVPNLRETRLEIATPPTTDPISLAISPDGRQIVFVATSNGKPHLWIRRLDSTTARPLSGTESAYYPFWAPDSRSLAFFAEGRLKRIDLDAGSVQTLATATAGRSGDWAEDGVIYFAPQAGPTYRIPAAGGQRAALPTFAASPNNGRFPRLLPDGRHFLYALGTPNIQGVYVGRLDAPESRRLLDADAGAVYARGHVLFVRQGTLFAQRFDVDRLELTGTPVPVASGVAVGEGSIPALSTSAAGPIVFRTGSPGQVRQLVWLDRFGKELERVGDNSTGRYGPWLSPDARTVALTRSVDGNSDVWLMDLQRGVMRRFTSEAASEHSGVWSPDGSRIVFSSNRGGFYNLYVKAASGAGREELLATEAPEDVTDRLPSSWSLDGRYLLYRTQSAKTRYDLWAWPLDGTASSFPIAQTEADERDGEFSPDGKWVAFESDESGRFEIYVQRFPGPGTKWPISTSGGAQVRWSRDGRELFYIALDGQLTAVSVRLDAERQTVEAGAPVALFATHVGSPISVFRQQYAVSGDGRRFLFNTLVDDNRVSPITIIQNWQPTTDRVPE